MRENVTMAEKSRATQRGVRRALREHALLGRPVVVCRDGLVVELSPPEILAELRRQEEELSFTDER
jgi:hypothetical protein